MIIDAQEYLYEWEKANNPFYPNEMKWDRLTVNKFLRDYKQQLPIASHAVLAEVRAMKQKNNGYEEIGYGDLYVDGYNKAIDDVLEKLSEHFRQHRSMAEVGVADLGGAKRNRPMLC